MSELEELILRLPDVEIVTRVPNWLVGQFPATITRKYCVGDEWTVMVGTSGSGYFSPEFHGTLRECLRHLVARNIQDVSARIKFEHGDSE